MVATLTLATASAPIVGPLVATMPPVEIGLRVLAGVLLILINAYFVAVEFGLTRLRQYPASEIDTPALERAWEMTDDLEFYLTTCQVWISGTSIALGVVAEPGLAALFEPLFVNTALASAGAGSLLGFFLINMVHLTHGEQTPTYLGVERSKQVVAYGARPLYWFAWLISPLIRVGDWVAKATLRLFGVEMTGSWTETETDVLESRAELRTRLGSMMDDVELPEERREEVLNALDVDERPVAEIATPPEDVVALSTAVSVDANLERIRGTPHSRFPLVGDDDRRPERVVEPVGQRRHGPPERQAQPLCPSGGVYRLVQSRLAFELGREAPRIVGVVAAPPRHVREVDGVAPVLFLLHVDQRGSTNRRMPPGALVGVGKHVLCQPPPCVPVQRPPGLHAPPVPTHQPEHPNVLPTIARALVDPALRHVKAHVGAVRRPAGLVLVVRTELPAQPDRPGPCVGRRTRPR